MSVETAKEVKEKRVQVMGKELGLLYDALYNEILWIKIKWMEFEELYGYGANRIEIMNKSAPFFFFVVEKVLWNDIILGIARITDNQIVAREKTVTIISLKFFSAELYLEGLKSHRGSLSLLYRVRDGLKRDDEVRNRKLNGTTTEDDFAHQPI